MTPQGLRPGNERIREAAKLHQRKFRRQTGCLLIEGMRLVGDALAAGASVCELFYTTGFLESDRGKLVSVGSTCECTPITEAAASKLAETCTPQGVFAVVEFAPPALADVDLGKEPLVLIADGVADPGNLGTMIRSAAALGASCVVATGRSCDVTNPKCVRATMGAIFRVPVVARVALADAVAALRSRGLRIVAAVARDGRVPWDVDLAAPTALLIGPEAEGLPESAVESADERVTIPMPGGTESLNAAASAAALLYEAARQRRARR